MPPDGIAGHPPHPLPRPTPSSPSSSSFTSPSLSPALSHCSSPATPSTSSCLSARRLRLRRRLSSTLPLIFFFVFPALLSATDAVSCTYPNYSTVVQPGQTVALGWQVSAYDSLVYSSLSAELYCMDVDGPEGGQWRPIGTIFSNVSVLPPAGQFDMKFPYCGPLAGDGAIRIVAVGGAGSFSVEEDDSCYFSIAQGPMPQVVMPPVPKPQPLMPTVGQTTQPNPPSTKIVTQTISSQPSPSVSPTPDVASPISPISPSSTSDSSLGPFSVTASSEASSPTPSASSSPSDGGVGAGVSQSPTSSSGHTFTTLPPLPPISNGGSSSVSGSNASGGSADGTARQRSIMTIGAALGGVGVIVCLAFVVASFVIRRRRRRIALARASHGSVPRLMESGSGAGGFMKETKRRLRLKRIPKEGYFYQMDDQDEDASEAYMEEKDPVNGGGSHTDLGTTLATVSYVTGASRTEVHSNSAGATAATVTVMDREMADDGLVPPLLALPPHAHINSAIPPHMRDTPSPPGGSLSRAYSLSSARSSFENSSVIRKYWAASMAARAERTAQGYPAPSVAAHDLEHGGYMYEEGSLFGDGSSGRDSMSRMADILSLRTAGSGSASVAETMRTSATRYRYRRRRSTLNSFGAASSFANQRSSLTATTATLSSIPDSLMITEEEYLERLHMHQMQLQLEQEYYDRYYPVGEHSDSYPSRSTISRSSSIPSLSSSNDPFKTFDSNEVLVDEEDPFSDERASQRSDWRL